MAIDAKLLRRNPKRRIYPGTRMLGGYVDMVGVTGSIPVAPTKIPQ